MVDAIVLAGTDKKRLINGENKAFLKIDGRYVIDYVIDALKSAKTIEKIAIVGPEEKIKEINSKADKKIIALKEKGSLLENAVCAYDELSKIKKDDYTFFITGDIPLITKKAISNFIMDCFHPSNKGADVYFPIIEKESIGEYNELKRPYVKLKEGEYRISNFILMNAEKIKNTEWIGKIFKGRKLITSSARVKLLYYFPDIFWKYFISKDLTLDYIENRASDTIGAKIRLIETKYPETTLDIDDEKDYGYIRSIMLSDIYKKSEKKVAKNLNGLNGIVIKEKTNCNNSVNGKRYSSSEEILR